MFRLLFALFVSALAFSASAARAQETPADGAVRKGAEIPIPFRFIAGRIVIPVTVNGVSAFMMVDTAAPTSLDKAFASEHGIEAVGAPQTIINPFDVSGSLRRSQGVAMDFSGGRGAFTWPEDANGPFLDDLKHLSPSAGVPISGILGSDVLKYMVLQFDFRASVLTLHVGEGVSYPETPAIPLQWFTKESWRVAMLTSEGADDAFIVDTGAPHTLNMALPNERRAAFLETHKSLPTSTSRWGEVFEDLLNARLDWLELGGVRLENAPVTILPPELEDMQLIGTELLSRYEVWLDGPGARLWLLPNEGTAAPFQRPLVGISVAAETGMIVTVDPGGPADRAGVKAGVELVAILDEDGREILDRSALKVGEAVTLVLGDGTRRTLTVEEQY